MAKMEKTIKILIILLLILIIPIATADSITDFKYNKLPKTDSILIVSGRFLSDTNQDNNVQCDTFILDKNETRVVARINTTFTNPLGKFSHSIPITYPTFVIDKNYIINTNCFESTIVGEIQITQKETIEQAVFQTWDWIFIDENIITIGILILFLLFFLWLAYSYQSNLKRWKL